MAKAVDTAGVVDGDGISHSPTFGERSDRNRRWTTRRVAQIAVLGLPVAGFAAAGWVHRWIVDDGFIYLRVVRQITAGHGPVFNIGQRVETFTSPIWLALLTIADVVTPIRLEWIAVVAGIVLSCAGVVLAMAGGRLLVRTYAPDAFLIPFGVIVFMVLIPVWIFETSGLENGLVFAWIGACSFLLARWSTSAKLMPVHSAVVIGLGGLVRPEFVLFSMVFLLGVLAAEWRRSTWTDRFRLVGAAIALPVAYEVFRMGYYGEIISNPGIVKEGLVSHWGRGRDYLNDFAGPYWLWVPILVIALGGYLPLVVGLHRGRQRRALVVVAMLAAAGLLDALYVVRVGGDWMHARLLLPGLFAVLAPAAVIPATRAHAAAAAIAPWVVMSALTLRPPALEPGASVVDQFILPGRFGVVTTDDSGWGPGGPGRAWFTGPAYYYSSALAANFRRPDVTLDPGVKLPLVVMGGIGRASFAIPQINVLDLLGLANTLDAHMTSTPSRSLFAHKPGHEKLLPSVWVAAMITPPGSRPNPKDFPQSRNTLIPATSGDEFQEQVAWARAALTCPDIRELLDASQAPLTPGRFLRNLAGSVQRTRLRIPPAPQKAYEKFCGPGIPDNVRALHGEGRIDP